jgi:hypothetical protein
MQSPLPPFYAIGTATLSDLQLRQRSVCGPAGLTCFPYMFSTELATARMPPRQTESTRKRKAVTNRKRPPAKAAKDDALDTAFVDALSADFVRHGASAIAKVREDDPVTYMKLCAQVLPKTLINDIDPLEALSDEELRERARQLAEKAGLGSRKDPDGAGAADEPQPADRL